MKRREFIAIVGGAAVAWPLAARAQQTSEIPRIGFVYQGSQAAMALRAEAILSGLRVSGYAAPAQIEIVARAAEGDPAQIAPLVADVIANNVRVIMASGPLILNAARSARAPFLLSQSILKRTRSPAVWQLSESIIESDRPATRSKASVIGGDLSTFQATRTPSMRRRSSSGSEQ